MVYLTSQYKIQNPALFVQSAASLYREAVLPFLGTEQAVYIYKSVPWTAHGREVKVSAEVHVPCLEFPKLFSHPIVVFRLVLAQTSERGSQTQRALASSITQLC